MAEDDVEDEDEDDEVLAGAAFVVPDPEDSEELEESDELVELVELDPERLSVL